MILSSRSALASTAVLIALCSASAFGQTGYGVNAAGQLFSFDLNAPATVNAIGPVGFVPEGIDFRPGTSVLYTIDVGPNTTQLYTINITTGQATAVGGGFNSTGDGYNLTTNQTFGFDFNPKTLQLDNSMRIRLVGTSGTNLRLNSSTGLIQNIDIDLAIGDNSPFVDAAAYINNWPEAGGTTQLYDMDSRNDDLFLQNPPNNGTLTTIGAFGVTVDASRNIHFDIFTPIGSTDTTIAEDFAYAVLKRPDAPIGGPLGAYLLYNVNLGTGQITNGAKVGDPDAPQDFEGGFAILPVPEPASIVLALACGVGIAAMRRR